MHRRDWLKQVGLTSFAALPGALLADTESIDTESVYEHAVRRLVSGNSIKPDKRVEVHVPDAAANGAVVPVGVISHLPDTQRIVLLVDNHTRSIVAKLDTTNARLAPSLSTHLQLERPATITALVKTSTGWHSNDAHVKTLGESC